VLSRSERRITAAGKAALISCQNDAAGQSTAAAKPRNSPFQSGIVPRAASCQSGTCSGCSKTADMW
jgi:hypothetical protein